MISCNRVKDFAKVTVRLATEIARAFYCDVACWNQISVKITQCLLLVVVHYTQLQGTFSLFSVVVG